MQMQTRMPIDFCVKQAHAFVKQTACKGFNNKEESTYGNYSRYTVQ